MLGILRFRPLVLYLAVITAYDVKQVLSNDMTLVKLSGMKQARSHWCNSWANAEGVGFNAYCLSLINHEIVGETWKIEVQHHQKISTTKTLPCSKSQ
jgi:hypothetical protein